MKYSWNKLFTTFKEHHPDLVRRGMSFQPNSYMEIIVSIPSVGKLIYNGDRDEITWIEHWVDEKAIKRLDEENRLNLYDRFYYEVTNYMKRYHMTQQQFADMVGISRRSLSKYLNYESVPKVSTMREICKSIDIDI